MDRLFYDYTKVRWKIERHGGRFLAGNEKLIPYLGFLAINSANKEEIIYWEFNIPEPLEQEFVRPDLKKRTNDVYHLERTIMPSMKICNIFFSFKITAFS